LKNAIVAFFNLAQCRAKLIGARKTATFVAILTSHPCDDAARSLCQRAAIADVRHLSHASWNCSFGAGSFLLLDAAQCCAPVRRGHLPCEPVGKAERLWLERYELSRNCFSVRRC
jgi:hypothetical protein